MAQLNYFLFGIPYLDIIILPENIPENIPKKFFTSIDLNIYFKAEGFQIKRDKIINFRRKKCLLNFF